MRRRTQAARRRAVQGSGQDRHGRHLPELRNGPRGLEGAGAEDRRQRPCPLFHRAHAPAARSRDRYDPKKLIGTGAVKLGWKRVARQRWFQVLLGTFPPEYLRFVFMPTTFTTEPPHGSARIDA